MRVGFDARWYNDSGVGAYVQGLLRAMAAAQHELELAVYVDPHNVVPGLDRFDVATVPVRAAKYSLAEQFELRRRARVDKLDVFHSPFYVIPLGLHCPVVVTVHDLIPFLFRIYSWPKQTLVRTGYRVAARRASHVIAVSENTAHDLQGLLAVPADRITRVYNAINNDCFHSNGNANDIERLWRRYGVRPPYVVASSARNWRTKNLATALQAIAKAQSECGSGFQTVVYGPPDGLNALGGSEPWATLDLLQTGYVDSSDLALLFRHARAFIMPSFYEGFGLPILEAMACGCPVITSNGGSLVEIAGKGGQVFAPNDVEGMAAALTAVVTNQENYERWRHAALRRAADFSWELTAQQTISVYHRVHDQRLRVRELEYAGTGSR